MDDLAEEDIEKIIEEIADSIEIDELSRQVRSVLYKACEVAGGLIARNGDFDEKSKDAVYAILDLAKASKTLDYASHDYDVEYEPEEDALETMAPEGSVN